MAYTTIDDPSAHFHIQLWTGDDNADRLITNDANAGDFRPDLLILKNRSSVSSHGTFDSSRLASSESTVMLRTNSSGAEENKVDRFGGFETDGFTVDGNDVDTNASGDSFVAWQWKANGGSTSSNTSGTITSTVQANTTAGFSIITYTGTGSAATIGHSLGVAPNWIIVKSRGNADVWNNLFDDIAIGETLEFNTYNMGTGVWNDTRPTSTVFSINDTDPVNRSSGTFVAYCFAEKQGYSKFGKYTGNGSTDGPFIYTGFKPAWIMIKNITDNGESWEMWDNARDPYNILTKRLKAEDTGAEVPSTFMDFVSNGVKQRNYSGGYNDSGKSYIYMAFAEQPFVTSGGVPCTAR